jgi:hypothetical protein
MRQVGFSGREPINQLLIHRFAPENSSRNVGNQLIVEGEEFHGHQAIPLSRLETDLKKPLNECADSGETVVVEMPDQRLLAIQLLDPNEDDTLMDELLSSNPKFQALVAKSKASPRKPFGVNERS